MKKHILPILFAAMSLGLAACNGAGQTSSEDVSSSETSSGGSSSSESKTVASIALSGTYQTEYILNEGYNPDGLVVTATYSDQSRSVVDEDDYEVSGFDSTTLGEKTVTVSYSGKTASFTINVNPEPTYTVTINVTVGGIESYDEFHSLIYLNSEVLGSATNWGTEVLIQSTTDVNVWSIVIEDVQSGVYDYNFVYGDSSGANYSLGTNTEGTRSFTVDDDTTLNLAATFDVPDVVEKTVTYQITPKLLTSPTGTPSAIDADTLASLNMFAYTDDSQTGSDYTQFNYAAGVYSHSFKYYFVNSDASEWWVKIRGVFTNDFNITNDNWTNNQSHYVYANEFVEDATSFKVKDAEAAVPGGDIVVEQELYFNALPDAKSGTFYRTRLELSLNQASTLVGLGVEVPNASETWAGNMRYDHFNKFYYFEYDSEDQDIRFDFSGWGSDYNGAIIQKSAPYTFGVSVTSAGVANKALVSVTNADEITGTGTYYNNSSVMYDGCTEIPDPAYYYTFTLNVPGESATDDWFSVVDTTGASPVWKSMSASESAGVVTYTVSYGSDNALTKYYLSGVLGGVAFNVVKEATYEINYAVQAASEGAVGITLTLDNPVTATGNYVADSVNYTNASAASLYDVVFVLNYTLDGTTQTTDVGGVNLAHGGTADYIDDLTTWDTFSSSTESSGTYTRYFAYSSNESSFKFGAKSWSPTVHFGGGTEGYNALTVSGLTTSNVGIVTMTGGPITSGGGHFVAEITATNCSVGDAI